MKRVGDTSNRRTAASGEVLRQTADEYLEHAIWMELVESSRLLGYDERNKRFMGYTAIETLSGVQITRLSNGDMMVAMDYSADFQLEGHRVTIDAHLPKKGEPVVFERIPATEHSDGHSITLDSDAARHEIRQLTKWVDADFGIDD